MILTILLIILFFSAFIIFAILGYKQKNSWYQLIAISSFVASSNCLKEVLPLSYSDSINTLRIIIGLVIVAIFIHWNLRNKKVTNK